MIEELLLREYGLSPDGIEQSAMAAGSETYFITCGTNRYVLKFPDENEMNHAEAEPRLCAYLSDRGLPVSRFIRNTKGELISFGDDGRKFHLQTFIPGKVYAYHAAPAWLLKESARTLGEIHTALAEYHGLPEGIGAAFFQHMTPDTARRSYFASLETAKRRGDAQIADDLCRRIDLLMKMPAVSFDLSRLSMKATHGDYGVNQLICGENKINAVIDWTTACVHPAIWEIIRSFVYAAPGCANGSIDEDQFTEYVEAYLSRSPLTEYDLQMMPALFRYQLAVCDYYGQYYQSASANREIFLKQAVFSTKLLQWLTENGESLQDALIAAFPINRAGGGRLGRILL